MCVRYMRNVIASREQAGIKFHYIIVFMLFYYFSMYCFRNDLATELIISYCFLHVWVVTACKSHFVPTTNEISGCGIIKQLLSLSLYFIY